jgi:hypothetical protein
MNRFRDLGIWNARVGMKSAGLVIRPSLETRRVLDARFGYVHFSLPNECLNNTVSRAIGSGSFL